MYHLGAEIEGCDGVAFRFSGTLDLSIHCSDTKEGDMKAPVLSWESLKGVFQAGVLKRVFGLDPMPGDPIDFLNGLRAMRRFRDTD